MDYLAGIYWVDLTQKIMDSDNYGNIKFLKLSIHEAIQLGTKYRLNKNEIRDWLDLWVKTFKEATLYKYLEP